MLPDRRASDHRACSGETTCSDFLAQLLGHVPLELLLGLVVVLALDLVVDLVLSLALDLEVGLVDAFLLDLLVDLVLVGVLFLLVFGHVLVEWKMEMTAKIF